MSTPPMHILHAGKIRRAPPTVKPAVERNVGCREGVYVYMYASPKKVIFKSYDLSKLRILLQKYSSHG